MTVRRPPDASPAGAEVRTASAPARPRHRRAVAAEIAGTVGVAAGAGWAVYHERATLLAGLRVLAARTEPDWVVACIGAQCLSMVFFALLQQRLLTAGGARLTTPWLLATSYLANGVAVAVPVIGSGMAAGYAYQQLRQRRVDPVIAQAALALAGVISSVAFAAMVAAGALLSGSPPAAVSAVGGALSCLAVVAAGLVALRSAPGRARLERLGCWLLRSVQRIVHYPRGNPAQLTSSALERLSLFRLSPATVGLAFVWGLLNWAADAGSFILAIRAIGVPVPWAGVLLAWSAGQGAASFSPTPAGIGVVEIAMTAALTAAGPRPAYALAAVLLYRVIALKTIFTLGWFGERTASRYRHAGCRRSSRGHGRSGRPAPWSSSRSSRRPG
jgi:putative heme transporter